MFSLIIAIVAIALIVVLMAVSGHFSSDVVSRGNQEAEVARSLNGLTQIHTALIQYRADTGKNATTIQDLMPNYLSSVPYGWTAQVPSQEAFQSSQLLQGSEEQKLESCEKVNDRLGLKGAPPNCSEIDPDFIGCCIAAETPSTP